MECGVCWHVYDPAEGDPVRQIAPGTPFADLPEDWRCPNCDAPREQFLRARRHDRRPTRPPDVGRRIAARYRAIAEGPMAGLPICNPALGVADVGFRAARGPGDRDRRHARGS